MKENRINLIMPMAGGGSRFKKEGYALPKPLLMINGYPFFFWAVESIRASCSLNSLIFCVLKEHIEQFHIDDEIKKYYPYAKICVIDHVLKGAVLTAIHGVSMVNDNLPIIFNDCDHMFFASKLKTNLSNKMVDGMLLTFSSDDPRYSYVILGPRQEVIGTIEKKVASSHAICGAYYFRNKVLFLDSANTYLNKCAYSEFFMSGVYNVLVESKKNVSFVDTDFHVSFGTPEEYLLAQKSQFFSFFKGLEK